MDDRVDRLLDKAEKAIDRNDTDQAEAYAQLAGKVSYLRRKEARELERQFNPPDTVLHISIDPADIEHPKVEVEDE